MVICIYIRMEYEIKNIYWEEFPFRLKELRLKSLK